MWTTSNQQSWVFAFIASAVAISTQATASGFVRQQQGPQSKAPRLTSPSQLNAVSLEPPHQQESWIALGRASLDDSGLLLLEQAQHIKIETPLERALKAMAKVLHNRTVGKIVRVTNFMTSATLLASGLLTRFSTVPLFLGPIHRVWLGTTLLSSSLSLTETATNKGHPAAVRNWLMSFQVMSICLSCLADWAGPFSLAFLKNPVVSRAIFCRLSGLVSLFNLKNLHGSAELMEHRKDKAWNVPRFIDALTYVMPNAIGLVWSGYLGWFVGLRHSKKSYMNFLSSAAASPNHAAASLAYYTCFISAICALATPWIANMRDEEKVLSKRSEVGANLGLAALCLWINGLAFSTGLFPFPGR